MFEIEVNGRFHQTFPEGGVGVLLIGNIDNSKRPTPLDARKREIERRLQEKYAGYSRADFLELKILQAYRSYYKKFNKTYHVQLQLESVVQKGKSLPNVSPLVDANFAAELETLVLTAGHDADLLVPPITLDATQVGDEFVQMSGKKRPLKPNDMMMSDGKGIICTIIYGQDKRTPISPNTKRALYVAYAPEGVPVTAVQQQLKAIHQNILLFAPNAQVELQEIYAAQGG
ncbi:phenylalanine--tRNA ligase beta subunit-related protein [Candidatus Leptofilum sp.]|uniref:phenylalanine--tRNA ligase beta subunit-related protein n=1 Tax=Candidatus Leptofilum sp. TaxID=3241576 RepID=UPI003B5C43A7